MNYDQAIRGLYRLGFYKWKLGLERIEALLNAIGNPEKDLTIVHVAGSNGKGSVCAMIESTLNEAGYKVGMFTSPHLISFTERIRVGKQNIPKKDVSAYYLKIRRAARKIGATYFEAITAMALLYFKEKDCNIVVLETGLGGRLDSTNAATGTICAITNISLEHTKHLGSTVAKIAKEKAGIIKKNSLVLTGATGTALQVIKKRVKAKNARLLPLPHYQNVELNLSGEFQKKNAILAQGIIKALKQKGYQITQQHIKKGLSSVHWPGRMQQMQTNSIVDSAHNPAGAKVLREEMEKHKRRIILIIGMMKDKNLASIMKTLCPLADIVIVTKVGMKRAAPLHTLTPLAKKWCKNVYSRKTVKNAVQLGLTLQKKRTILIAGSCFVAGDALAYFNLYKNKLQKL